MNEVPETTQYDVNLPKPRPHKVLVGVLVTVLLVVVIGVAAAAIANRTAQGPTDSTVRVMPANMMLYASLNTHTDKLPNFNVIADAWKDSKEAKQVAAALQLAFTQAGLSWEDDVQPWLGDRVAVGLVDLGGIDKSQADQPRYRPPFFIVAAQTTDRAKSDAFLTALGKELGKTSANQSVQTETYRDIPISYLTSSGAQDRSVAWATVNDNVVLTINPDNMKTIINAALDGQNLTTAENFKTVMGSLADQNAGALYMDYGRLMPAYFDMITGISTDMPIYLACEFEARATEATPDADCVKQRQDEEQHRTDQQRQLQDQMQQVRDMLQAFGGVGAVMTYEPTGIRFDAAAQYDITKMPENLRQLYETSQTPSSGRIFASIPASAILAVDLNLQGAQWDQAFNLDQYAGQLGQLGVTKEEIAAKLAEFQKLIGVDLKTDFLDLLNGEAAVVMLPKADQTKSEFGFSLPFQFAALFDSSDANRLMGSTDKVLQGLIALGPNRNIKTQSLSGLPYSVLMVDDKPVFTYGVVDGRFVIGTDSNTLLAIDHADQAPLANADLFKQATASLPGNRTNTFFMNFAPLWNLVESASGTQNCEACNYLKHFGWMSAGSEPPANGMERGSLHIGITP